MIYSKDDYRYVTNLDDIIVNGEIMPYRTEERKRDLRGEDVAFLMEYERERFAISDYLAVKGWVVPTVAFKNNLDYNQAYDLLNDAYHYDYIVTNGDVVSQFTTGWIDGVRPSRGEGSSPSYTLVNFNERPSMARTLDMSYIEGMFEFSKKLICCKGYENIVPSQPTSWNYTLHYSEGDPTEKSVGVSVLYQSRLVVSEGERWMWGSGSSTVNTPIYVARNKSRDCRKYLVLDVKANRRTAMPNEAVSLDAYKQFVLPMSDEYYPTPNSIYNSVISNVRSSLLWFEPTFTEEFVDTTSTISYKVWFVLSVANDRMRWW